MSINSFYTNGARMNGIISQSSILWVILLILHILSTREAICETRKQLFAFHGSLPVGDGNALKTASFLRVDACLINNKYK